MACSAACIDDCRQESATVRQRAATFRLDSDSLRRFRPAGHRPRQSAPPLRSFARALLQRAARVVDSIGRTHLGYASGVTVGQVRTIQGIGSTSSHNSARRPSAGKAYSAHVRRASSSGRPRRSPLLARARTSPRRQRGSRGRSAATAQNLKSWLHGRRHS